MHFYKSFETKQIFGYGFGNKFYGNGNKISLKRNTKQHKKIQQIMKLELNLKDTRIGVLKLNIAK